MGQDRPRLKNQKLWVTLCLLVALVGGPFVVTLSGISDSVGFFLIVGLLILMAGALGYAERRAK
jgi:MprA protease rhombosortase-interaction domain-containing protein